MTAALLAVAMAIAVPPAKPLNDAVDAGRCVTVAETPDARVAPKPMIAPGPPPLLSFRYYEGKAHHRYNNADLMLDDAGH
jgi:hypothetical protein